MVDCVRGCGLKVSKNEELEYNCIVELCKVMIKNKKENEVKI